jgi:hypothetical protein
MVLIQVMLYFGLGLTLEIYIFTSNFDLALDKIEHLLSIPSLLGPGDLLINPIYDNLRDLPRFQKIVNSTQL